MNQTQRICFNSVLELQVMLKLFGYLCYTAKMHNVGYLCYTALWNGLN